MGDYNINTMNEMQESTTLNQEFYNIFPSHYYHKLINLPTRERKNSSTLLDNIYTNIPDCYNTCTSGVLRFFYTIWPLLRRIRVLEEKTTLNLDRLAIQLASMDSRFSLKLLVHGTGLLSLKLRHWLYLDQIFLTISVHPFRIIP